MLSFDSSGDFVSCVVLLAMYMCYMIFSRFVFVISSVRFPLPERCYLLSLIVLLRVRVRNIVVCLDFFRLRNPSRCSMKDWRVVARVCVRSRLAVASPCVPCCVL